MTSVSGWGTTRPNAQFVPSLRRAFPDIPQPLELPPSQKRRYLFQGLSEALAFAARTRSYFFVLEDLHWADESTLALLNHLANRVAQLPVVFIGTIATRIQRTIRR
jgi:predicted ATPase